MKKIYIIFLLIFGLTTVALAQNRAKFEMGKKYYDMLGYSKAIPYFEEYLNKSKDDVEAMILLANCYKSINDYQNAEKWLIQIVSNTKNTDNKQLLYLSQVQQSLEKYPEAMANYNKYLALDNNNTLALNQSKACNNLKLFDDKKDYLMEKVGFNSDGYDFGTCIFDNKFLYSSTGNISNNTEDKVNLDMYLQENYMDVLEVEFSPEEYTFSTAKATTLGVNTKYHEGPLWITSDNKTIYFTRNDYNPGIKGKDVGYDNNRIVNLKIYKADLNGTMISNIIELPFNSSDYSCGHPVFDEHNQVLIFVSDRPGGFGETDLWYSKYNNGQFEEPLNFGDMINTNGKEMFPYVDAEGLFYFASNGHGGLGGLDIFSSKLNNLVPSKPNNMGKPLNSSFDDFALYQFKNSRVGFISSNRTGGAGKDDIYMIVNNKYELDIQVIDANSKVPITTAEIQGLLNNEPIGMMKVNTSGSATIEIKGTNNYDFTANAPYYLPNSKSIYIEPSKTKDKYNLVIELYPLVAKFSIIDAKTKKPISGATVDIKNPCDTNNITITTDANGEYYYAFKKPCKIDVNTTANSYFPKRKSFNIEDNDDTLQLLVEMDRIHGDDLLLKNIYYDYDKSNIREDALADLLYLYNFLSSNPTAKVELSSHTDARANDAYNLALSQRRADAVKSWLINKGIKSNRIIAVGYGENKPINNCTNDIKCTEEEHQMNRRTEFRVLNAGEVIQSVENNNIKIDRCIDCEF